MIAIVDYGVGNLFSLKSSFDAIGEKVVVTADKEVLKAADKIILPGVGAFGDAAAKLRNSGLSDYVKGLAGDGKPFMGICLGMQLLFDRGYEYGVHEGLGLIPGEVRFIGDVIGEGLKTPHIGWNGLHLTAPDSPIFKYVKEGDCVYFVHSYAGFECDANLIATTQYGTTLTAAVQAGNIFGCQFHPEKSGTIGLSILKAFAEWEGK